MFVLQKLMVLGDGWEIKARENLRTGSLLLKKMGISISGKLLLLMKFNNAIGKLYNYISNIAYIPDIEEWEQKRQAPEEWCSMLKAIISALLLSLHFNRVIKEI